MELEKLQSEELLQLKQVGFMTPAGRFIHSLLWKGETLKSVCVVIDQLISHFHFHFIFKFHRTNLARSP
jgi:hypothetical protein